MNYIKQLLENAKSLNITNEILEYPTRILIFLYVRNILNNIHTFARARRLFLCRLYSKYSLLLKKKI